jgi:hypothetical protein
MPEVRPTEAKKPSKDSEQDAEATLINGILSPQITPNYSERSRPEYLALSPEPEPEQPPAWLPGSAHGVQDPMMHMQDPQGYHWMHATAMLHGQYYAPAGAWGNAGLV